MTKSSDVTPLPFPTSVFLAVLGFSVLSAWAIWSRGLLGFVPLVRDEPWALQMLVDLALAAVFACKWIAGDARRRGLNPWPFMVATFVTGSFGILAYALWRAVARRPRRPQHPSLQPA